MEVNEIYSGRPALPSFIYVQRLGARHIDSCTRSRIPHLYVTLPRMHIPQSSQEVHVSVGTAFTSTASRAHGRDVNQPRLPGTLSLAYAYPETRWYNGQPDVYTELHGRCNVGTVQSKPAIRKGDLIIGAGWDG